MTPPAVPGRCRWVTSPATCTRRPASAVAVSATDLIPAARSRSRRCSNGCPPGRDPGRPQVRHGDLDVVHLGQHRRRPGDPDPLEVLLGLGPAGVPQRLPAVDSPSASSKTPAVASASSCRASSPARRDRSTWSANGRSSRAATIRSATDVLMPRTESSPRRTAYAVSRRCSGVGSGVPGTHSVRCAVDAGRSRARSDRALPDRQELEVGGAPGTAPGRGAAPRRRAGGRRGPATAASRTPSAGRAAARRGTPPGSAACTTSWRRRAWRRTARGSRRSRSSRRTGSAGRSRRPRRR